MRINDLTRCPLKAKSYKNRGEISFIPNDSELTNEVAIHFSTIHIGTHIDFKSHKKLNDQIDSPSIFFFKKDEVFYDKLDIILGYEGEPDSNVKCLCINRKLFQYVSDMIDFFQ